MSSGLPHLSILGGDKTAVPEGRRDCKSNGQDFFHFQDFRRKFLTPPLAPGIFPPNEAAAEGKEKGREVFSSFTALVSLAGGMRTLV